MFSRASELLARATPCSSGPLSYCINNVVGTCGPLRQVSEGVVLRGL